MLVRLPGPAASSRLIHCHRHVRRPIVRVVAFQAVRTYATPGRPKSVVGEASKPVKRTTSRAKATPTSAKSTAAKTKSTKSTAKKPAAKKAAPKKVAPKKKAKPVKKTLTEEQKATQKAKVLKRKASDKKKADVENVRALKQQALKLPVKLASVKVSAFNLYFAESLKDSTNASKPMTSVMTDCAKRFVALSVSEKETFEKRAEEVSAKRRAELKKWIESHTAAEIGAANRARARLNKIYPVEGRKTPKYQLIPDERHPKRAMSAWLIFLGERNATGEYNKLTLAERTNRIATEYKQLSPDQRKDFDRKAQVSRSAYEHSYLEIYGKAPPPLVRRAPAAAA